MKKGFFIFLFGILSVFTATAQETVVKGSVKDAVTDEPIPDVTITVEETGQTETTDAEGQFKFTTPVPFGEQMLKIEKIGFLTKRYPIVVNEGKTVDIQDMTLEVDRGDQNDLFIISLSDDQLNSEDDGVSTNVSGLLSSSKDAFLRAAAFDFSATFFRPRGLDNANGKVLINGLEMNKQSTGRPQWGNWGGLNDVQRNQEFSMGLAPNDYNFGDLGGTNNIVMRASKYREGGRVSFASANRSYEGRIMASYNSGILEDGWSYSLLASRRFGDGGFIEGTLYDANSFFASVEKQLGEKHSLNFTSIYAQNRRGRATAITNEVYELKGREYNPFWGEQNGEIRNSRIRKIEEPIVMLNHYWTISDKTSLNTNIGYQFGSFGDTRIDNGGTRLVTFQGQESYIGGARNTSPIYYQNLPSYHLNRPEGLTAYDYELAYQAEQEFINDGQFDWNALYIGNQGQENSIYAVQEDRTDDKQLMANILFDTELNDNIRFNAAVNYRSLKSENYAVIQDLLGGTGYLDIDFFNEESAQAAGGAVLETAQADVRNPNRIVREGDRYKYNYEVEANVISGFAQSVFKYKKIDFYLAGNVSKTDYQRNGLFQNGYYGPSSFGKSAKKEFNNYGVKAGATFKLTGRHLFDFNGGYLTKAPTIRNTFNNARQSNSFVIGLESETITSADASYIFRSPIVKARLTGFYSKFEDGTDIGFFFSEGGGGNLTQEVITNINRQNIGGELGIEAQVTPTIKLKGAASFGQFTYTNNPDLYYTSQNFVANEDNGFQEKRVVFGNGKTNLKDYHVSGGPERAFQLGFEYRDPDYWNVGMTVNHYSNAYADVSALKRSEAFSLDPELYVDTGIVNGEPVGTFNPNNEAYIGDVINPNTGSINNINQEVANELLKQEQFEDYMLVNINGGKSWKVNDYFIGFFATINNVLNQEYRTGGFEQSRRVDYRNQLQEQRNPNGPVFGNRYFFGNGTTYYVNLYVRF